MLTRKRADPGLKLKSNIYIRDHESFKFSFYRHILDSV